MKYVVLNKQGFPEAFYSPDVHGERFIQDKNGNLVSNPECKIPEEAIEITDEQWQEFIDNPGRRRWDFGKKKIVTYEPPLPSLDTLKQSKILSLKKDLQNYIHSHYGQGTQVTLMVCYQKALKNGDLDIVNQIEQVWNWIGNVVLPYYYSVKQQIIDVSSEDELNNITWNFEENAPETNPIQLESVIRQLENLNVNIL